MGSDLRSSPAIMMPFVAHRALGYEPLDINESWDLRTIKSGTAYQLCKSLQCCSCHHLFLDIRFTNEEMAALYDDYRGPAYTALRDHYEPGYRKISDAFKHPIHHMHLVENFIAPYLNPHFNILDWGGDTGINTPFKNKAETIHIYDISNKTPEFGFKSIPRSALTGTIYDLIVCSHVLEHIPYPADIVKEIMSIMTGKTLLYIEVPSEMIMQDKSTRPTAHFRKRYWHEHINFFSDQSLHALLESCGLKMLAIKEEPIASHTNTGAIFQILSQKI